MSIPSSETQAPEPTGDSDPSSVSTDFALLIGPRGWGKTTFMAALLPSMAPPDRITIVSPIGALGTAMNHEFTKLKATDKKECAKVFGAILKSGRRQVLAMDEFDEYCPGGVSGNAGGYCCPELYDIVNYGRNKPWQIGLMVSTRGTADIAKNAVRGANYIFIFQATEPNQVEYVRRWIKQGDIDFETIVRNLPKYVAMGWDPANRDSMFTGFWKVIDGQVVSVTPDDPEWEPEWKSETDPSETTTSETPTPDSPPMNASTDGDPTPTPSSEPSTPRSGGSIAKPPGAERS